MKKCSSCFQDKLLTEFNNSNARGKQSMCKSCYSAYFKAWRARRTAEQPKEVPTSKTCLDCGLDKPISQFGKRSTSADKKNIYCKECWVVRIRRSQMKARTRKLNAKAI
jgi:RNase P subunit RPR2